tara:strand:- start:1513 stop:2145 length:633 start_codon:yes stop_codon:yes gene_type:complete
MFNSKFLHAASLFVSDDKFRHNLHGVRVEPCTKMGGSWYVATDGHCLFAGYDPRPIETHTGEHLLTFDGKFKASFSKEERGTFTQSGAQFVFTSNGQSIVAKDEAGHQYPNWRAVVQGAEFAEPSEKNCGFNVDYLAKFAKVREIVTGQKNRGLSPSRTNGGPAYISISDNNEPLCFGLIMPIRCTSGEPPAEPHAAFFDHFEPAARKAA